MICGWFACVGGLNSIGIMSCLNRANRGVALQRRMLAAELSRIEGEATILESDGNTQLGTVAIQLRQAASAIQADLQVYHDLPRKRYFFFFGQPVKKVLRAMTTLFVSQVFTYGTQIGTHWRTRPDDTAGSGSGDLFDDPVFLSLEH